MRATDLAKALHDLILKRGDIDIVVLDPMGDPASGTSDWTGHLGLISHPYEDGRMIGLIVPRPEMLQIGDDLLKQTIFHSETKQ